MLPYATLCFMIMTIFLFYRSNHTLSEDEKRNTIDFDDICPGANVHLSGFYFVAPSAK